VRGGSDLLRTGVVRRGVSGRSDSGTIPTDGGNSQLRVVHSRIAYGSCRTPSKVSYKIDGVKTHCKKAMDSRSM
jgi:hypothetical protein